MESADADADAQPVTATESLTPALEGPGFFHGIHWGGGVEIKTTRPTERTGLPFIIVVNHGHLICNLRL